ncbi:MAG: hypothetical protein QF849_11390 [Pseudomonadales bacterium]|nr:hypothetical protein [Pseudomonadales bacterium]
MKKRTRRRFDPDFRLEAAQLVVDQKYSIREAPEWQFAIDAKLVAKLT